MFLLFPLCVAYLCNRGTNLHSNMFLLFPFTFYARRKEEKLFTFQYVSIISRCTMRFSCCNFRFTFQYVSIISGTRTGIILRTFNLHSNMFLLFRRRHVKISENSKKFTFQYVSIISF